MSRWFKGRQFDGRPWEAEPLPDIGSLADARQLMARRDLDAVVFNNTPRALWLCCLARQLAGGRGPTIVCVDLLLQAPYGLKERVKAAIYAFLLRQVALFVFFHRDTSAMERLFGIPRRRIRYVPFKVNDVPLIRATTPTDGGYILSCGRSKRDYDTLIRAVDGLDVQLRILVNPKEATADHGSILDTGTLPPNVQIVTDDGSPGSWVDWIARCSFMALPLRADSLHPSGVSAYVVAMALGKCVVITEGVATRGILEGGEAVIVPPHDVAAMRSAVTRVASDPTLRAETGRRGREYAESLGDEARLSDDIAAEVGEVLRGTA
jgi:glycosyltransferase involved in cell wall biosynthesis